MTRVRRSNRMRWRVESLVSGVTVVSGSSSKEWYMLWWGRSGVVNLYEPRALAQVAGPREGPMKPPMTGWASPPDRRAARLRRPCAASAGRPPARMRRCVRAHFCLMKQSESRGMPRPPCVWGMYSKAVGKVGEFLVVRRWSRLSGVSKEQTSLSDQGESGYLLYPPTRVRISVAGAG